MLMIPLVDSLVRLLKGDPFRKSFAGSLKQRLLRVQGLPLEYVLPWLYRRIVVAVTALSELRSPHLALLSGGGLSRKECRFFGCFGCFSGCLSAVLP